MIIVSISFLTLIKFIIIGAHEIGPYLGSKSVIQVVWNVPKWPPFSQKKEAGITKMPNS